MSKNQRKDIIEQIKDLSHSRKSVHISDLQGTGINFFGGEIDLPYDPGADTLLPWDKVFYLQDIGESTPTEEMFVNIENMISPRIGDSDIVCLSNLRDVSIDPLKNLKYTTLITARQDMKSHFKISGKCKATFYINDMLLLTHVHSVSNPYTQTTIEYNFTKDQEYKIEVFVYCHLPNVYGEIVELTGSAFNYVKSARIPLVEKPRNVFATNNLPDVIRVSWEQSPAAPLNGGGTEIWAKSADIDATYLFLDRVSYPTNFYIHASQIGSSNVLPNGDLQDLAFDGPDWSVPENNPEDPTGILNWGVEIPSATSVIITPSDLVDYTTVVTIDDQRINILPLSEINSYSLLNASERFSINSNNPVHFNYTSEQYIRTGASSTVPVTVNAKAVFAWESDDVLTNADVRCTVYKNSVATTVVVGAVVGSHYIPLSAGDLANWAGDPSWIEMEFRVKTTDKNSDPETSLIKLKSMTVEFNHTDSPKVVQFISSKIAVEENEQYVAEYLYRSSGSLSSVATYMRYYDYNGNVLGNIPTPSNAGEKKSAGGWTTFILPITVSTLGAKFAQLKVYFQLDPQETLNTTVHVQKLHLLKSGTRSLPSFDRYTYQVRNYTNELSLSGFTLPVTGSTSEAINYLSLESDDQYVSHFNKSKLYVRGSVPLSSVSVEAQSFSGHYTVPLQQIGASSNEADFTFEYKPLFSVPVVVDNFSYEPYMENPNNPPPIMYPAQGLDSAEISPARVPAQWRVNDWQAFDLVYAESDEPPYGIWPRMYPDAEKFKYFLRFPTKNAENYKEYDVSKTAPFYRNIFGNNDIEPGGGGFSNYHQLHDANKGKFSFGMLFRFTEEPLGSCILSRNDSMYRVVVYTNANHVVSILCYLRGLGFTGGTADGDIIFRHDFEPHPTDWYYYHVSADIDAMDDPNRTYTTIHNISQYPDHTVANIFIDGYGGFQNGRNIFRYESEAWNWEGVDYVRLGTESGSGEVLGWHIDSFYLTADIIEKATIDDVIAPIIAESKNPYYASFGYKTNTLIEYYAEGMVSSGSGVDQADGAIPYDADILTDELSQTIDWNEPDGTIYIMRDAFTLTQDNIEQFPDLQHQITYSLWNNIYVDFTSPYSDLYKVRFSNDRLVWSKWRNFNDEILYPWKLLPIGQPQDTTEGGWRNVYAQVISETGNTSDVWLKPNHRDTIVYNPIGSIGSIESYNYVIGRKGWALDLTGNAEFSSVTLREYSLNLGRNINLLKTRESNVGTQIRKEYSRFFDNIEEQALPGVPNITSMAKSLFPEYPSEVINYNSDFAVDFNDKDIVFIPSRNSVSNMLLYRQDLGANTAELIYYGEPSLAQDPYAMVHVSLSEKYIYVTANSAVYKYAKIDFATGTEVASNTVWYTAQGVKLAWNGQNELIVCIMSTSKAIDKLYFSFYDEDLELIRRDTFTLPGGIGIQPDYKANSFDYNGQHLAFSSYDGFVHRVPIGINGIPFFTNLNNAVVTVDILSIALAYNDKESMAGSFGREFRVPTGIKLFGDIVFAFTQPANDFITFIGSNSYNIFAALDFKTVAQVTSEEISGLTSLMFIRNSNIAVDGNHAYLCRHPNLTAADILGATSPGFTELVPLYGAPLFRGIAGSMWSDYALGFTPPTLKGNQIVTSYTASIVPNNHSSLYYFDFNGKAVGLPPKVHPGYSVYKTCCTFYSGNFMYWLGNVKLGTAHILVFGRILQ